MVIVSVPEHQALDWVGPMPDTVRLIVWDGDGGRPDGADGIELFVGRYDAAPPSRETLASLPALTTVQVLSAGVEPWVPVVPDGVVLCNGRGVHGASTAELAVAGLLSCLRDLPAFAAAQKRHEWNRHESAGLDGRRVLVVGAGDIGRRIAQACRAFEAEVALVGRTARDGVHGLDELPELVPAHDVLALAVPATARTHKMVDADLLAALPDDALVVNVARGSILDTGALLAELQRGRLRAFLDVVDPEPLSPDHPLWDAPNLVLTPHVGGGTRGWRARGYALVGDQIRRYAAGEPLINQVGPDDY